MADITITIPDAVALRVLDAFAFHFGYDPLTGGTKLQFAKARVMRFIKDVALAYERKIAAENAAASAAASVEADITLT